MSTTPLFNHPSQSPVWQIRGYAQIVLPNPYCYYQSSMYVSKKHIHQLDYGFYGEKFDFH